MYFLKRKTDTKLILGLGNPGSDYVHNRHNLGFLCLNHFVRKHNIRFDRSLGQSQLGSGKVAGTSVVVANPQTYMNHSGEAVKALSKKFNVALNNIIVIHDDLDLSLGKIRIRQGGGSAGHKGIDSIISCLHSQDFTRLRVGIGRPQTTQGSDKPREDNIMAFVLSDFTPSEKQIMSKVIPQISEAVHYLLAEGLVNTMNRYN